METIKIIENHLNPHDAQAGKWAYVALLVVGIAFLATFGLSAFTAFEFAPQVMEGLALGTVAISLFLATRGLCFSRLRKQTVKAEEQRLAEPAPERKANSRGLETIGRLAGGVAHDFNNSLMVLLNCIEIMRTAEDSMTRQSLLADMESAARGAQSTAQQLMSLSREGSAPGQPSDPRTALRSIASNLRRMLPENITVRDLLRGTPTVSLVSGKFEQVILNLCLDAREAMRDGGDLTLRCYKDPIKDEVLIEIEHNGDASLHRYRDQDDDVVMSVVEAGGTVDTRIDDDNTLCVIVTLPVVQQKAEPEQAALSPADNRKALLLDDNELVLTMLSTRLAQAGYDITTATSVSEAQRMFDTGEFDALVCDAILPDGTPQGVIEKFRQTSQGPVVICSGYPKSDPILADLATESAEFLQKPFSTDELLCRLGSAGVAA